MPKPRLMHFQRLLFIVVTLLLFAGCNVHAFAYTNEDCSGGTLNLINVALGNATFDFISPCIVNIGGTSNTATQLHFASLAPINNMKLTISNLACDPVLTNVGGNAACVVSTFALSGSNTEINIENVTGSFAGTNGGGSPHLITLGAVTAHKLRIVNVAATVTVAATLSLSLKLIAIGTATGSGAVGSELILNSNQLSGSIESSGGDIAVYMIHCATVSQFENITMNSNGMSIAAVPPIRGYAECYLIYCASSLTLMSSNKASVTMSRNSVGFAATTAAYVYLYGIYIASSVSTGAFTLDGLQMRQLDLTGSSGVFLTGLYVGGTMNLSATKSVTISNIHLGPPAEINTTSVDIVRAVSIYNIYAAGGGRAVVSVSDSVIDFALVTATSSEIRIAILQIHTGLTDTQLTVTRNAVKGTYVATGFAQPLREGSGSGNLQDRDARALVAASAGHGVHLHIAVFSGIISACPVVEIKNNNIAAIATSSFGAVEAFNALFEGGNVSGVTGSSDIFDVSSFTVTGTYISSAHHACIAAAAFIVGSSLTEFETISSAQFAFDFTSNSSGLPANRFGPDSQRLMCESSTTSTTTTVTSTTTTTTTTAEPTTVVIAPAPSDYGHGFVAYAPRCADSSSGCLLGHRQDKRRCTCPAPTTGHNVSLMTSYAFLPSTSSTSRSIDSAGAVCLRGEIVIGVCTSPAPGSGHFISFFKRSGADVVGADTGGVCSDPNPFTGGCSCPPNRTKVAFAVPIGASSSSFSKAFVTFCLPAEWTAFWQRHPEAASSSSSRRAAHDGDDGRCVQPDPARAGKCECPGSNPQRSDAPVSIYSSNSSTATPQPGTLTFCKAGVVEPQEETSIAATTAAVAITTIIGGVVDGGAGGPLIGLQASALFMSMCGVNKSQNNTKSIVTYAQIPAAGKAGGFAFMITVTLGIFVLHGLAAVLLGALRSCIKKPIEVDHDRIDYFTEAIPEPTFAEQVRFASLQLRFPFWSFCVVNACYSGLAVESTLMMRENNAGFVAAGSIGMCLCVMYCALTHGIAYWGIRDVADPVVFVDEEAVEAANKVAATMVAEILEKQRREHSSSFGTATSASLSGSNPLAAWAVRHASVDQQHHGVDEDKKEQQRELQQPEQQQQQQQQDAVEMPSASSAADVIVVAPCAAEEHLRNDPTASDDSNATPPPQQQNYHQVESATDEKKRVNHQQQQQQHDETSGHKLEEENDGAKNSSGVEVIVQKELAEALTEEELWPNNLPPHFVKYHDVIPSVEQCCGRFSIFLAEGWWIKNRIFNLRYASMYASFKPRATAWAPLLIRFYSLGVAIASSVGECFVPLIVAGIFSTIIGLSILVARPCRRPLDNALLALQLIVGGVLAFARTQDEGLSVQLFYAVIAISLVYVVHIAILEATETLRMNTQEIAIHEEHHHHVHEMQKSGEARIE